MCWFMILLVWVKMGWFISWWISLLCCEWCWVFMLFVLLMLMKLLLCGWWCWNMIRVLLCLFFCVRICWFCLLILKVWRRVCMFFEMWMVLMVRGFKLFWLLVVWKLFWFWVVLSGWLKRVCRFVWCLCCVWRFFVSRSRVIVIVCWFLVWSVLLLRLLVCSFGMSGCLVV